MSKNNLTTAKVGETCVISAISTNDEEMKRFLFSLGCFEGEMVTVISVLAENYVIAVKDGRYGIDKELAEAILI